MKLPLKVGLPLLGLLLVGLAFAEGREFLLLLVATMAVALWSAFSLPHPGPRPPDPQAPEALVAQSLREAGTADDTGEGEPDEPPRFN